MNKEENNPPYTHKTLTGIRMSYDLRQAVFLISLELNLTIQQTMIKLLIDSVSKHDFNNEKVKENLIKEMEYQDFRKTCCDVKRKNNYHYQVGNAFEKTIQKAYRDYRHLGTISDSILPFIKDQILIINKLPKEMLKIYSKEIELIKSFKTIANIRKYFGERQRLEYDRLNHNRIYGDFEVDKPKLINKDMDEIDSIPHTRVALKDRPKPKGETKK